jgi:glycosyltransferase 2 family protein
MAADAARKRRHCRVCRLLWPAFGVVVVVLLWRAMSALEWADVWQAVRARPWPTLLLIAAGALVSHGLFASFDVISGRYARHRLPPLRAWITALVCYAFTLNLGSIVGSIGLRLRLYRKQGLETGQISRVIVAAMAANWSGYALLLALLPLWSHDNLLARLTGGLGTWAVAAIASVLVLAYAVASWRNPVIRFRGRRFRVPQPRLALLLGAVGTVNWLLMGGLLWLAFGRTVPFGDALLALLAGAIAGVVTHVPGGWGVLEFVALGLLSQYAPAAELVAGVLVYRALYYLLPLTIAMVNFVLLERSGAPLRARRAGVPDLAVHAGDRAA